MFCNIKPSEASKSAFLYFGVELPGILIHKQYQTSSKFSIKRTLVMMDAPFYTDEHFW